MIYKGYNITAEVQSYDMWTIDDDGAPVDWIEGCDGIEVTGYLFKNSETGDTYFDNVSECDAEQLRESVNQHLNELIGAKV